MHARTYCFDERWGRTEMERIANILAINVCTLHGWDANKAKVEMLPETEKGVVTIATEGDKLTCNNWRGRLRIVFDDSNNPWEEARKKFDDSTLPQVVPA